MAGKIVFLPCGIDVSHFSADSNAPYAHLTQRKTGRLSDEASPREQILEDYREHGLVIDEDRGQPLKFGIHWTQDEVDAWFRRLAALQFKWLELRYGEPAAGVRNWVLAKKSRSHLFALKRQAVTGSELDEAKGTTNRNYKQYTLYISAWSGLTVQVRY